MSPSEWNGDKNKQGSKPLQKREEQGHSVCTTQAEPECTHITMKLEPGLLFQCHHYWTHPNDLLEHTTIIVKMEQNVICHSNRQNVPDLAESSWARHTCRQSSAHLATLHTMRVAWWLDSDDQRRQVSRRQHSALNLAQVFISRTVMYRAYHFGVNYMVIQHNKRQANRQCGNIDKYIKSYSSDRSVWGYETSAQWRFRVDVTK